MIKKKKKIQNTLKSAFLEVLSKMMHLYLVPWNKTLKSLLCVLNIHFLLLDIIFVFHSLIAQNNKYQ